MLRPLVTRITKKLGLTKKPKVQFHYVAITDYVVPLCHDKYMTANKTVELVDETVDMNEAFLEKQNGELVMVSRRFESNNGSSNFTVNGLRQGQILEIRGLGFLQNVSQKYEVKLVTDNCVFLAEPEGYVSCYFHKEIERIKQSNSLKELSNLQSKESCVL